MKNTNHFLTLIFLFFVPYIYGQSGHVLYGERNLTTSKTAIFLDKEGILYPDYAIPDSSLKNCNSSLKEWYSKNEKTFISISKQYNCSFSKFSPENCAILNDSIAFRFSDEINKSKTEYQSVTFLIHGFRKSFKEQNGDIPSPLSFQNIQKSISKYNPTKINFIEVYWDAMYDCCFSASPKNNKPLFQLFEESQINASFAGERLKKILTSIQKDTITIFTHSLGAKVAMYALLDIDKNNSPTPSNQKINICLIAPAISSQLLENFYYERNTNVDFKSKDPYNLIIVYNENDFALRKKDDKFLLFGPGPYKYGNTTLGCNYKKSAVLLEKRFKTKFIHSPIELYDFSEIGRKHHLENYCESVKFESIIRSIYR